MTFGSIVGDASFGVNTIQSAISDPIGTLTGALPEFGDALAFLTGIQAVLAGPSDPPITRIRTSHAALLRARIGRREGTIGGVFEMERSEAVNLKDVFEVNALSDGLPSDIIVQNVNQRRISAAMFVLNETLFERVFGVPASFSFLGSQSAELQLRVCYLGLGKRLIYTKQYEGVRMEDYSETASATDDRNVKARVNFRWRYCRPLL